MNLNIVASSINFERGELVATARSFMTVLYDETSKERQINAAMNEMNRLIGNMTQMLPGDMPKDLGHAETMARMILIMGAGYNPDMSNR